MKRTVRAPVAKFSFVLVLVLAFGRSLLATLLGDDGVTLSNQQNNNSYFNSPGSACTGIFLNYHMSRMFERLFGSRKFGSFLLLSFLTCYVIEYVLLKLVDDASMMEKGAAFYVTLPLSVVYFVEVPSTFHFTRC